MNYSEFGGYRTQQAHRSTFKKGVRAPKCFHFFPEYFRYKIIIFYNKESFIKFKYKNIMIGALVASTYLRENPNYGGEFNYSFNYFIKFDFIKRYYNYK